jgi:hypothetical protein
MLTELLSLEGVDYHKPEQQITTNFFIKQYIKKMDEILHFN